MTVANYSGLSEHVAESKAETDVNVINNRDNLNIRFDISMYRSKEVFKSTR